ncbi:MAG: helix-turn-helix domain-containing protein [Clostridia bacterium]|nr:helix-turn-helix domain-containing protein [Clostridia bacterium]
MSIGSNIKTLRVERHLTQEQVADMTGVTFQAVSSWERDEYKPDIEKLIALAGLFDVTLSALTEERPASVRPKEAVFDWEHMKTYVKTTAKRLNFVDTLKAIDFASEAHEGQNRKKSEIPYIYHPLNLACHALSMNIEDDAVLAACLLHDVIEDCNKRPEELPVSEEVRELVILLSHSKTTPENRDRVMQEYYASISQNPKASLIKCIDRCNNITTMASGLRRERIWRMIIETERYYPELLKVIKSVPEYNNAAWLLKYQIESMLEIYKRLM